MQILAPVDFSPQSQTIVDHACRLAERDGARLHVISVLRDTDNGEDAHRDSLRRLTELVHPADELKLETVQAVLSGSPHLGILAYAKKHEIDLIVMGTHGRRGLSRLTLGSVAERVLRLADCPVQVIKVARSFENTLQRAMDVLTDEFGEELVGTRVETERRIIEVLSRELGVATPSARELLDEAESADWAIWEPPDEGQAGKWQFVAGLEFLEGDPVFMPVAPDSPAVDLLRRACQLRTTDVHIDPRDPQSYRVRFRIDGQLQEYCTLDQNLTGHLVNQMKTMADLDISDPFHPKEGRIQFPPSATDMSEVEARLTTAPVAGGEAVAVRLCSRSRLFIPLTDLGFDERSMAQVDRMLQRGEGLILVTGPTGSGKTTTVYSMLETIGQTSKNMVSIEDPVEYPVPFVRQMEVNPRHGLTMVEGLKTLMRMDPDVLFLGETRDGPSAEIVMRAASSGRYVFSTLHTRDVASVITALRDLGLDDRSLAANLSGLINQRLVRKLCTHCREPETLNANSRHRFDAAGLTPPESLYRRNGCPECRQTGYYGRRGVFEAVALTTEVREQISSGSDESTLRDAIVAEGLEPLDKSILRAVGQGWTDLEEASRARALQ